MNTFTRLRSVTAIATMALIVTVSIPDARGQGEFEPSQSSTKSSYGLEIADGVILSTDEKKEATLENALDVLRDQHVDANIVVASEVPKVKVGNLKLRTANIEQALEALRVACGQRFVWNRAFAPAGSGGAFDSSGGAIDPVTGLPIPTHGPEGALYILSPAPASRSGLRVEAFNLTGYFNEGGGKVEETVINDKIDELERMVDHTIDVYRHFQEEVYGSTSSPRISLQTQFHRGANLLVLIGDSADIEIAAKVIQALPNVARSAAPNPFQPFGGGGFGEYYGRGRGGAEPGYGDQYQNQPPGIGRY